MSQPVTPNSVLSDWLKSEPFLKMQRDTPMHAALVAALFQRCENLQGLLQGVTRPFSDDWIRKLGALSEEMTEIVTWLGPRVEPSEQDIAKAKEDALQWTLASGATPAQALSTVGIVETMRKRKRGAPISHGSRQLAVRYVDGKIRRPSLNLPMFTRRNCPCGERLHTLKCQERIRQQFIALQDLFQKLRINWPLPAQSRTVKP